MTKINVSRLLLCLIFCGAVTASAQRQLEKLGRGVVGMRTGASSVYVGWRLLGTDPDDTKFNIYRVTGGVTNLIAANVTNSCNVLDSSAAQASAHLWFVQPIINGVTQANSASFSMPAGAATQQYLNIPLTPPPGGTTYDNVSYTYVANDGSAGDVDGDGEYEIFLKWDPTNSKDNSQSGFTGNTYVDCYKLNGTRLWRINMGPNIRSGAHYLQYMIYDFDGDGKAEMMCRTAPGTVDGLGNFVGGVAKWQNANGARPSFNNTDDYRFNNPNNSTNGYVLAGPEFLSVFNGLTGEEMASATYYPKRDPENNNDNPTASRINSVWGDGYGNRLDRFLAGIAFLDGVRPSGIFCRGYYTRAHIAAWDWRTNTLTRRWVFSSDPSNLSYRGQGAHSLSIGDADGDGKDEILYGAASIDDNGQGHYSTGLGHGDAEHFSDMDPLRPGLEIWMAHESPGSYGANGLDYRDAKTGTVIFGVDGQNADVGRGVAYDIDPRYRGYEMWGSRGGLMSATGVQISSSRPGQMNFCAWWDADVLRETLDQTTVSKWNWNNSSSSSVLSPGGLSSNNGTKANPTLSADLFGDWREEIIWRTSDNLNLRIYTTTALATNRIPTLMHDSHYRCAIAWQNTGYNQPPHPGFFIGQDMFQPPVSQISAADLVWRGGGANLWDAGTANWFTNGVWVSNNTAVAFASGRSVLFDFSGSNNSAITLSGSLSPSQVTVHSAKDFTFSGVGQLGGAMKLVKAGPARLTINTTNSFTGGTFVSGGTLLVNGTLDGSAVTVERRGTPEGPSRFGGSGRVGQVAIQNGCILIVGDNTNSAGTLTVSNGFTEFGNVLNHFDLSSDPSGNTNANDRVTVFGNIALSGTNTIEVRQLNGFLGGGVYPLFTYTGTLSGGLSNLALSGSFIQPVALTNPPGIIGLLAVIPAAPPNAPTNLIAGAIGAFQINVVWSDTSTNEQAFLIERSLNGVDFTQIDSVASGVVSYADVGLNPNTTYHYRVRGTNLAGASLFSNIGSATTTATPPTLAWRGDGVTNVWDIATTPNWFNGASLTFYGDGAFVAFDDSGSNNPAITVAGTISPGSVTVNATRNYALGGSGVLSGTNGIVKTNSGTLTLSGNNSFSGGVDIRGGTVALTSVTGAGSGPVTLNGGSLTLNAVGAPATFGNPISIQTTGTLSVTSGNNNQATSGAWTGDGTLNMSIVSGGTFSPRGSMSGFSGTVNLSSAGTFRFHGSSGSSAATFNAGSGSASIITRDGGTVSIGSLTGGSGTFVRGASSSDVASTFIIGGNNASTTFAGTITNGNNAARSVAITKQGTGTLTLTGNNGYFGATTVSAGKLLINGNQAAATGLVSVGAAGTLGGAGIIGGNTTVSGTLAPGTSIGTLTFNGNLTLASNSASAFEISKSPFTNDVARVLGTVTLGGSLDVVNVSPELLEAGDSFQLFDPSNCSGSFSSVTLPVLEGGLLWFTNDLSVNGTITVIVDTNPPPPFIFNVAVAPRVTSAIVSWNTLAPATSQIEYGFTTNCEILAPLDAALTADHAMLLVGLTPETNYFVRALAQVGTNTVRSATVAFSTSGTLILDNPQAIYLGVWTLGTSASDKFGSYYQYADGTFSEEPSATATYTPNIPVAAKYDVAIWYPAGANRATNTPVTIVHDGAGTVRAVDQTLNGGVWKSVASNLTFAAGTSGFVTIGNDTGDPNRIVMADAVRWSYTLSQDNPPNGIVPGWWSDFYFGGNIDATLDPDEDGFSTYAEYIHGTSPTNAASRLTMTIHGTGSALQIAFSPLIGGRHYELSATTNLGAAVWGALPDSPVSSGSGGYFMITNPVSDKARFYRLGVRLEP